MPQATPLEMVQCNIYIATEMVGRMLSPSSEHQPHHERKPTPVVSDPVSSQT
jgi:hypothetical protein